MDEAIKQRIIDKIIENPQILKEIDEKYLNTEIIAKVMPVINFEGWGFLPESLKTPEMYHEWLINNKYRNFKDVPSDIITDEMALDAFRADKNNINYFPVRNLTENLILQAIDVLSEDFVCKILNPLYGVSKNISEDGRLQILTKHPYAINVCDFNLVKSYYIQESNWKSADEVIKLQDDILSKTSPHYYEKLMLFFNGAEEVMPVGEMVNTNIGTIPADTMVELICSGELIDVLDNFNDKDLTIFGSWIGEDGNFVYYEYKGEEYIYFQGQEGEDTVAKAAETGINKNEMFHMDWSEVSIYNLVKEAEKVIEKERQKEYNMDDIETYR